MSAGIAFTFGPFHLDPQLKQLLRDGEPVAMSRRHVDLLCALVGKAGQILTKDQLILCAWTDVAVTDNSLEQAISSLRRTLDSGPDRQYIETQARRGYRFVAPVTQVERRESDATLDALLAPHRAWIEGRAALETLEREPIAHARQVFEGVLAVAPAQASAQVGLANACVLQFEMTRADREPDLDALAQAAEHSREACRLDPEYGEAWATLGFVLERTGHRADALAALRRAVSLEPDNWRHYVRLSYGSWGEERLRAAQRVLTLLPGFPIAHWLAATVHIARQAFTDAERELTSGLVTQERQTDSHARFSAVALHWLSGLVHLRRDDERGAIDAFERELASESSGHLYARECCANAYYAIGALHLRRGRLDDAAAAFDRTLQRVSVHLMARVGLDHVRKRQGRTARAPVPPAPTRTPTGLEEAFARGAALVLDDRPEQAAALVQHALESAESGSGGWLLPIEPLLQTQAAPDVWAAPLARLRDRAA